MVIQEKKETKRKNSCHYTLHRDYCYFKTKQITTKHFFNPQLTEIKFRLSYIIVTTYETEERRLSLADRV